MSFVKMHENQNNGMHDGQAENELLSYLHEKNFNPIAALAAGIFNAENASVLFLNLNEIILNSIYGLPPTDSQEIEIRNLSLSGQQIKTDGNNFLVVQPIKSSTGLYLGAVAVYDNKKLNYTGHQLSLLASLAKMVADELETTAAYRKTFRASDDRLHMMVHDLKNPMTTISLQSELVGRMPGIDERTATIAAKINQQSKRMVDQLNEILTGARRNDRSFKPQKNKLRLKHILNRAANLATAPYGNVHIELNIPNEDELIGDEQRLTVLFSQLIDNAIRFSAGKTIVVTVEQIENHYQIAIKDQGVGLTPEDLNQLFIKFSPLSSKPVNGIQGNKLGLIIARMMTDLHKGKIWAESEGKNKGTTFFVELPVR